MPARAEAEPTSSDVGEIKTIPQTVEIPEHIEKGGVNPVQHQITTQVTDDTGQPMTQSPATQTVTIQIPADDSVLTDWSKGEITDSQTWLGAFWLRMIEKAKALGKRVTIGSSNTNNTNIQDDQN